MSGSKFLTALKKAAATAADVLTTKGDLVTFSTTMIRLAVGSDGKVLTAKSSEASGLSWETPADENPTTTKGDLSGFSTDIARVPIGSNNQILTADSAQALGLKWAAPAAPTESFIIAASVVYTVSTPSYYSIFYYCR